MTARDFVITFTDGTEQTYQEITRSTLDPGVLSLYQRDKPSDAERHIVSLPLAHVRKWVKS